MSLNNLRVLIFDLGGTLFYEKEPWAPIIARAEAELQKVFKGAGIPYEPSIYNGALSFLDYYNQRRDHLPDLVEHPAASVLKELIIQSGVAAITDETIRAALRAMYAVTQTNWYPEEDALPTLQTLKSRGYRLGLISNAADDENTQQLIDKGHFRPLVEFIISSAACAVRKPHPHIFQLALKHFQAKPSEAVMIGDSLEADIQGANQLGMLTIWITRRAYRDPDQEHSIRPNLSLDSLSKIPSHLGNLNPF